MDLCCANEFRIAVFVAVAGMTVIVHGSVGTGRATPQRDWAFAWLSKYFTDNCDTVVLPGAFLFQRSDLLYVLHAHVLT